LSKEFSCDSILPEGVRDLVGFKILCCIVSCFSRKCL